jgi:hypothetical protein
VEEKGGAGHGTRSSWGAPDMSGARLGGGSTGTVAPGCARGEAGEERDGESGGKAGRWAGWQSGAQRQREKVGGVTVGGPAQRGRPNWQGKRGRRGGCHAGPITFKLKMNFDINFKSVPTWFESKPVFPN